MTILGCEMNGIWQKKKYVIYNQHILWKRGYLGEVLANSSEFVKYI